MATWIQQLIDAGMSPDKQAIDACKARILDYLTSSVIGRASGTKDVFVSLSDELGGVAQSSIYFSNRKTTSINAAAANAAAAHASESDDVHTDVTGFHPGVTIIPAVLAIAEARALPGAAVAKGILWGYEVGGRVGASITPSHRLRGFHATGTIGTLAAAAGAATAMGLGRDQIVSAIGLATSVAGGTFAVLTDGIDGKHLHAAHATAAGVLCALLAEKGLRGSPAALEANGGFLQAFSDVFDEKRLLQPTHGQMEIERIAVKNFPCCAHAFGAVELAITLSHRIDVGQIASIGIESYHAAAILNKVNPASGEEAKFSIPYCVAAALMDRAVSEHSFGADAIRRSVTGTLAARVRLMESDEANAHFPRKRLVRIQANLFNGEAIRLESWNPRGFGDDPSTYDDVKAKFKSAAHPVLGSAATEVEAHMDVLDNCPDWAVQLVQRMRLPIT